MAETLATAFEVGQPQPTYSCERDLVDEHWTIEITRQS
jgi:hypothetical protein